MAGIPEWHGYISAVEKALDFRQLLKKEGIKFATGKDGLEEEELAQKMIFRWYLTDLKEKLSILHIFFISQLWKISH